MPILPPADGVTQAVFNWKQDGQKMANVLHYVDHAGVQAPDPATLAQRLVAWWNTNLKASAAQSLSLESVTATDLSSGSGPGVVYTTGLPLLGSGSNGLPNNVTCVVSLRTALRGRSFRGRLYHVGLIESQVTDNALTTSFATTFKNAYQLLLSLAGGVGDAVFDLVVLSYYANHLVRLEPVATPVVTISTDAIIDSQRRRLPGRGR